MTKLIMIGGTAYSGSTLLDMLLGNDPNGFSCGEIHALKRPFEQHHFEPQCGCSDPNCQLWPQAQQQAHRIHEFLLERDPSIDFLVDSSKSLTWITDTVHRLEPQGWDIRQALIWKTPAEYFESRRKRSKLRGWARSWINYHQVYLSIVGANFTSIRYRDLVAEPHALCHLSKKMGIRYFNGKANYWERNHHTVFGNVSAKIHLHDASSDSYADMQGRISKQDNPAILDAQGSPEHRSVYYQATADDAHKAHCTPKQLAAMEKIERVLLTNSCLADNSSQANIEQLIEDAKCQQTDTYMTYYRGKRLAQNLVARLRR